MATLQRLFRSREVKAALTGLAESFGLRAQVLSHQGKELWSATGSQEPCTGEECTGEECKEQPVVLDGRTLGTVRGVPGSGGLSALTQLVVHLARQESEKSALIQDSLTRYGEVNAYYNLASKLAGNLKPDQVAMTVLTEAMGLIKANRGFVLVRKDSGEGLELLANIGPKPSARLLGKVSTGVTGAIYNSGRAEIVNELVSDPRHVAGEKSPKALMGVPLTVKGEVMGVVCVTTDEQHDYRTEDLYLLSALCVTAATAIENARLYMTLERRVAARTLELFETLNRFNHELVKAGEYVKSLIPPPMQHDILRTDWRFVPSTSLGGDIFGYHWMDEDRFVIYLLDVCGHGIGAALLSVSVMNVLRTYALPQTDFSRPAEVLASLNRTFPMADQNGMYFTIWYGVFDRTDRTLSYASGGHFPALFFSGSGDELSCVQPTELATKNIFIGGVPGFPYVEDTFTVPESGRLYVFSDGTFEHRQPDGTMWEYDDFKAFLCEISQEQKISENSATTAGSPRISPMDTLLSYAQKLHQSHTLQDDFTILQIDFAPKPE